MLQILPVLYVLPFKLFELILTISKLIIKTLIIAAEEKNFDFRDVSHKHESITHPDFRQTSCLFLCFSCTDSSSFNSLLLSSIFSLKQQWYDMCHKWLHQLFLLLQRKFTSTYRSFFRLFSKFCKLSFCSVILAKVSSCAIFVAFSCHLR